MHMPGHPAPQRSDAAIARGGASIAPSGATSTTSAGASIALSGASIAPLRKPARVAIAGATGYAGQELLRLRARLVANPGCYPTASLLALVPLVQEGLLMAGSDVVIDAKSGVSGAGKTPSERTHFSECHASVSAYGVFDHRHAAEIEQRVDGR